MATARLRPGAAGEPCADPGWVGGGVEIAVRGGRGLPAGLAGEDGPAAFGAGEGLAVDGVVGHGRAPG